MPLIVSVPDLELAGAVAALPPALGSEVEFVVWAFDDSAPPRDSFDIVVPPYLPADQFLPKIERVRTRLVQQQSIGYDGIAGHLPPGLAFANAATVHETATSELAVTLALAMQRGIPGFVHDAAHGVWNMHWRPGLADRRVLLLGYGGVNQAVEKRLAGFDVDVVRVARTARDTPAGRVHGLGALPALLSAVDIVIAAVPLDPSTQGLVSAAFLAALPDDALVINVARGPVADTAAILAEASSGRLRFALDVTDPEPLPADHPLWSLPNVLVTPHVGGASDAMGPRMVALIRRQIDHALNGEPFENVVLRG